MRRDTQDGKPDYTLIDRDGLRRYAQHLTLGAGKYGRDNWRLANSQEELERFKSSAFRHFLQWLNGDRDEDHASAVKFNLDAAEYVNARLTEVQSGPKDETCDFSWGHVKGLQKCRKTAGHTGCHTSASDRWEAEAATE